MSRLPGSAITVSLPSPPKAMSDVWSRMLTVSSPSPPKTMSWPPPRLIGAVPGAAEERLGGAAAGEGVVAGAARRGAPERADFPDGGRVAPAEAVVVQRLARANVQRERHQVRPVEFDARTVGLD